MGADFLRVLWRRRVLQITAVYVGAAWGIVGFIDWGSGRLGLSTLWADVALAALLMLVPAVFLVANAHGNPKRTVTSVTPAVLVIVAAATLLAWFVAARSDVGFGGVPVEESRHRQLTYVGSAAAPAFSPDGRYVAFLSTDSLGSALLRVSVEDGSDMDVDTLVPAGAGRLRLVGWTVTDGLLVRVLGSAIGPDGTYRIAEGSGKPEHVSREPFFARSSDGTRKASTWSNYQYLEIDSYGEEASSTTARIDLPDAGPDVFTNMLLWSPTAPVLAVTRSSSSGGRLFLINVDSGELWNIVESESVPISLQYSPDGRSLYYVSAGRLQRLVVDEGSGEPAESAEDLGEVLSEAVAVSPDGRDYVYVDASSRFRVMAIDFAGADTSAYGSARELSSSASVKAGAMPSPDGSQFVLLDLAADSALTFYDLATGTSRQIRLPARQRWMDWSLDGHTMAVVLSGTPHVLVQLSVNGGAIDTIAQSVSDYALWCTDSELIYRTPGSSDYARLDLGSGETHRVLGEPSRGWLQRGVCSPDGRAAAFNFDHFNAPGLWLVTFDGTQRMLLPNDGSSYQPIGWSPSGDRVYFYSPGQSPFGLYSVSPAGGPAELELRLPSKTSWMSLSRDGSTLATVEGETISDLMIHENFRRAGR